MDINAELRPLVTKIKNRIEFVEHEVAGSPKGRLGQETRNGRGTLLLETYDKGRRKRRYLTKDPSLAASLLRRDLLKAELDTLLLNYKLLTVAEQKGVSFDVDAAMLDIKKRMSAVTDELLHMALSQGGGDEWAAAEYEASNYRPEERRHTTSRGLKVRSKSELLIAEKLYEYSLPFRYEQVLHFPNVDLSPDFTVRRADGKLFYWEHHGLTQRNDYMDWQKRKAELYASVGIVPWNNYIVTYDNEDGEIDLKVVDAQIRGRLLL